MRRCSRSGNAGQVTAELALIVGAIAVVCMLALLYLSGGINRLFDSASDPMAPGGPFTPPTPAQVFPTSLDQCAEPGWRDFPQFSDQTACEVYVEGLSP